MNLETYLTNKKLLLSLGVLVGAVILSFTGVWIHSSIVNSAEQKARMYQTALQVTNDDQLNYSIDTKQGRILAPVTIEAVDLVKFPEMNKEFPAVYKIEETYTEHSRQDCTTNSDGDQSCHTEYYYTWDQTDSWSLSGQKVIMADREYSMSIFSLPMSSIDAKDIINNEQGKYVRVEAKSWIDLNWGDDEGDKRYAYRVLNLPQSGTVFLNVTDSVQAGSGNRITLDSRSAETIVREAQNSSRAQGIVFTVLWVILIIAELIGFGYYVWFY